MSSPRRAFLNGLPTPAPQPFSADTVGPPNRYIEIMGRAVDDVVGSFVDVAASEGDASHTDVLRLAAAARRLWTLAADLGRARRTPS